MAGGAPRWLLIGNSRWHWAEGPNEADDSGPGAAQAIRQCWSESPPSGLLLQQPEAWAAVGPVPASAGLDPARRVVVAQVPLALTPPWLGIDRALAGWQAWREGGTPVLVADGGTVLSLTRVDGQGRFAGGRLIAGAALQLRAMGAGTEQLPMLAPDHWSGLQASDGRWPQGTREAMAIGVLEGLAAALDRAACQVRTVEPGCELWLTGGDAELLLPLLVRAPGGGGPWQHQPSLCLDGLAALAALRPGPNP